MGRTKKTDKTETLSYVNNTRAFLNELADGALLIKDKKRISMHLYHHYLNLEKTDALDDSSGPLTEKPRVYRTPKVTDPVEVIEAPKAVYADVSKFGVDTDPILESDDDLVPYEPNTEDGTVEERIE